MQMFDRLVTANGILENRGIDMALAAVSRPATELLRSPHSPRDRGILA